MEVLGIVSSPRKKGNTDALVQSLLDGASSVGHKTVKLNLNDLKFKGCQACMYCRAHEACSQKDDLTKLFESMKKADMVVFSSPIYMGELIGQFRLMEDRMFQFMDVNFQPRIKPTKKAVIMTSQGNPDPKAFDRVSTDLARILTGCGFDVVETLKVTGGNDPNAAKGHKDLMEKARKIGSSL
jgi:multimeric flavodoxin WrbA